MARKPPPSASSPTVHRWLSLWLLSIYNLLVFTNFQNFLKISRLLGCNSHWVFGHNPNNSRLIRGTSEEEESQVRTSIFNFNSFLRWTRLSSTGGWRHWPGTVSPSAGKRLFLLSTCLPLWVDDTTFLYFFWNFIFRRFPPKQRNTVRQISRMRSFSVK